MQKQFSFQFLQKNNVFFRKESLTRLALMLVCCLGILTHLSAQTYPANFSQVLVANGLSGLTSLAFAPDGRLFVTQQNGTIRIVKNGALLPTPFVTIGVHNTGERGLLGIAFDPNFSTNNYVYVYYTLPTGANNRISRFTANGDLAVAGSEVVLLNLSPLSSATNHNGGDMKFGLDGKLYVGIGENANPSHAQNLDTYHGKILRINTDGSAPADNPFTGSVIRQRIWAYGVRNPYTLSVQPGTGRIFINDVGQAAWEEVNEATIGGRNFGWPTAEGASSNPAFTNPIYQYNHSSGIGTGCAITGGTFFNPTSTNYPAQYVGKYFFLDYCNNWIDYINVSGSTVTRTNFASSIGGSPVGIATGTDGNLYYLSRGNNAIYKIVYSGVTTPVINQQPQSISVSEGNAATFSVTASGSGLTYQWRKNGVNISGATSATYTIPVVSSADQGAYSVLVSNASGNVTSTNATLTVTAPNQSPTASIQTPVTGTTYAGGQSISFSGTATDPEDGTLPASAFRWYVDFHHDTHTHPGPGLPTGASSGTFVVPTTGETSTNVFYRIYLEVTDSQGAKHTTFTDIVPRTSTITIVTNPAGLQVTIDGQPQTSPVTIQSVEGVERTIGVVNPQSGYTFSSWSHGGSATQTIVTPVDDVTYTAHFVSTPPSGLCFEAESAQGQSTFAPYQVLNDVNASGGKYIIVPNPTGTQSSPTNSIAVYQFTISEAATYNIWLRILAPTSYDNSLFLRVDNASYVTWSPGNYTTWTWKKWSSKAFTTGTHSLSIARNEDGMGIDKVVITKSTTTPTGTGCGAAREEDFMPEMGTANSTTWSIAPNPIENEMHVNLNLAETSQIQVELLNALGQQEGVVAEGVFAAGNRQFVYSTEKLPAGVYVVRVTSNNSTTSHTVIKK